MGFLQRPRVYVAIQLLLCASAGLVACDQQATEQYLGEPLLRLQGTASIAVETGGRAVTPALCFSKRDQYRMPASFEKLPAEVREAFSSDILANPEYAELIDEAALWLPASQREIVEVETVGEFPAAFKIAAYVPPGDDFVLPAFQGEPPAAEGRLCAVRTEHPHVVHRPVFLNQHPNNDGSTAYRAFLDADSDAFHLETWHCPSEPGAECVLESTEGDDSLALNDFGIFVEAEAEPVLVYLAEPAAPGSYTAWKYGARDDGLSTGFHLFDGPGPFERVNVDATDSCRRARADAFIQISAEYGDRVLIYNVSGLAISNVETDPVLNDAFERRLAELTMERCEPAHYAPISTNESISLKFSVERVGLSPPSRLDVQQSTP